MERELLSERTRGRWHDILTSIGIPSVKLNGKSQPCPMCGGKDRYAFDDKEGTGSYICRKCGAGYGLEFVRKFLKLETKEAIELIESRLGESKVRAPKAQKVNHQSEINKALWEKGRRLDGVDVASRYLATRGIAPLSPEWLCALRVIDGLNYKFDDGSLGLFAGMIAAFRAPDGKSGIVHRTFLTEPPALADVPKQRMIMPGKIPEGGAVRLGTAGQTMGIAEGIETALSAALIHKIPVWAALSAGSLMKWQPPIECEHVIIFGDLDRSFEGQTQSYNLAHRLVNVKKDDRKTPRFHVEVNFTLFHDNGDISEDWNDQLRP